MTHSIHLARERIIERLDPEFGDADWDNIATALRATLGLHRPMTMYEHEDGCEETFDEHRESRHIEGSDGEYYCLDLPTGVTLCAECSRDLDFDGHNYPCETVILITAALGEARP